MTKTDLGAECHGLNPLSHQVCWSFGYISNNFILFANYTSNVKDCLHFLTNNLQELWSQNITSVSYELQMESDNL